MNLRLKAAAAPAVVALFLTACGPGNAEDSEREWVGTVTTEGDVTTVVNESGSVWGGTATLVEEALIGVEVGDDPYMLGDVRGIAATEDRIYVVDQQVPALRVYDWNGRWLRDFGRRGQGPGEFQYPTGVGVDGQGRVWVHESISTRMLVFSGEGETLATLNLGGIRTSSAPLTVTSEGHAYVFDLVRSENPAASPITGSRRVMRAYDIDGNPGEEIDYAQFDNPGFMEVGSDSGITRYTQVPFYPLGVFDFGPNAAAISGYPDTYRFEVRGKDGRRVLIERNWDPVPVLAEEAAAHERAATRFMQGLDSNWSWTGPEIPATKPAYSDFVPALSGEIWVVRPGRGIPVPDCDEDPAAISEYPACWDEQRIIDVFGADGRYLGELDLPPGFSMQPLPVIRDNDVIARVEDDAGTIMVKRYRLVVPEEPQ